MNLILYFTGTGNCLHSARCLAQELGEAQLIRLCKGLDVEQLNKLIGEATTVGIVVPTYAGTIPFFVEEHLAQLNWNSTTAYVYSVATCGGSVLATHMALEVLLRKKGNRLDHSFTLTYPSNFQIMSAPEDEGTSLKRIELAEEELRKVASSVRFHEKERVKINGFLLWLANTSRNLVMKKDKDRHYYSQDHCISCGLCAKVCPVENIILVQGRPKWGGNCETCMACLEACPVVAIQYKEKTKTYGRYLNPKIKVQDLVR